jgi:uncharacterized repeat protein (TIGR03837 family)
MEPNIVPSPDNSTMQWDVFCRVIDNFGDIGVCWRLSADLAARGESVRLWIDDPSALTWMAPRGASGVSVQVWTNDPPDITPGDVVIESFGCEPPPPFIQRMAATTQPPVWINLEYLSAEAYVERSHRLPSPQLGGPSQGLTKWFFYPGFTPATGGLIREPGLLQARSEFQRMDWLQQHGIGPRPDEHLVSLFCYEARSLPRLMAALPDGPVLLLATAGAPADLPALPASVRIQRLPYLLQADYDRLLWACDLNLVRGEDSFVRAQWAGQPFIWQIYPQSDQAHAAKLDAFLTRFLAGLPPADAGKLRGLWRGWNHLARLDDQAPSWPLWTAQCRSWRDGLAAQPDLTTQLLGFAMETR